MRPALRLVLLSSLLAGAVAAQPLTPGEIVVTNAVPPDASENALLRVNPNTGAARPLARLDVLRDPQRLAPAPDGGVYAAQGGLFVFHVDAATAAQRLVTRSLQGIDDIDLAPNGDLLVLESSGDLLRLDPATGATTVESSLSELPDPNRISVRSNSEVFVSDRNTGQVYLVEGEVQTRIPVARSFCFDDIVWDGATGFLFGLECGGAIVRRIDPATGQYDLLTRDLWLATGSASPPSMTLSGGDLLVTTSSLVVRIDPATGAQEIDLPALQLYGFGDIARGSGASYYLRQGPNLLRFDPATGAPSGGTLLAMSSIPEFPPSTPPRSVALTPDAQVLVVLGETLVKIDPATRSILLGPPGVANGSYPGVIDGEPDGNALTGRAQQILRIEQGVDGVEEFASGNNLSSIRGIVRETTGRVLALEGDEIVRVFPNGSQSIVTRNQLFGSGDVRDLTVGAGGDIFVTNGMTTDLIRVAGSNPDTNQSPVAGGADLGSAWGIAVEHAGTLLVAVNNPSCRGIARVTPSIPSTSCFAEGARFESPFGVAVNAPEPGALALGFAALGAVALLRARHRRASRAE